MTDISVRHDPSTGEAAIEIRGAELSETRFRLRDPYTEKYLTKRGWSKTATVLPGEAAEADGVTTIPVAAELARRIVPGTNLVLDQPAGDFQEVLTWPLPVAMPIEQILAEETPSGEKTDDAAAAAVMADATEETTVAETEVPDEKVEAPAEEVRQPDPAPAEAVAAEDKKPSPPSEPLLIESFEPSIMHDDLAGDDRREAKPEPAFPADNDNQPSTWKPIAIAAAICLLAGTAIGAVWNGYGSSVAMKEVREAAASQIERQKWEFDRQLKDARDASAASLDKTSSSLTGETKTLTADRDAARKALAEKEKTITSLKARFTTATTQLEAVKSAAGDKAKTEIAALGKKIGTLSADLDKAKGQLAEQDQTLRDTQAKLADANDRLASTKETAKQEAEALNDDLAKQTGSLGKDLDGLKQQLAQRDAALRDVQAKLSVANIQIDALKTIANKTTEAGLEKGALDQKVASLSTELDKTGQELSDREQALSDANAKHKDAEAKLAEAGKRNDQLVADADNQGAATRALPPEGSSRLQEERDLYADELKKMTASFTALQQQKADLEKTVAELQSQTKTGDTTTTSQIPQQQSIWGATAIDTSGAVYHLQNQPSREVATANVNALCRNKSGSRCETLATYSNSCFSLARFQGEQPSSDNFAYFIHKDSRKAAQTALERCESMGVACTTRFTSCSPENDSKSDLN